MRRTMNRAAAEARCSAVLRQRTIEVAAVISNIWPILKADCRDFAIMGRPSGIVAGVLEGRCHVAHEDVEDAYGMMGL